MVTHVIDVVSYRGKVHTHCRPGISAYKYTRNVHLSRRLQFTGYRHQIKTVTKKVRACVYVSYVTPMPAMLVTYPGHDVYHTRIYGYASIHFMYIVKQGG